MKNIIFIFFPILLISQPENELKIRILQDRRIEQSSELFSFLKSEHPRERELAALALANIQDTSAVEEVAQLLSDEEPSVRSMAAFAIGMIGKSTGASYLIRRLAVEREEKCIAELFNGLGLCGTQDDLKKMVQQVEDYRTEWQPYVIQAIIRFANRKIKDVAATKYAATLLYEQSTMINATYALLRINDTTIVKKEREKLLQQLSNSSSLVRMWSATTLGALDDDGSVSQLLNCAKNDKDWRVRVNALRALRSKKIVKPDIVRMISDKNEHVALAALSSYDAMVTRETPWSDSAVFISMLQSNSYANSVKEEVRLLIAKKLGERSLPYLATWKSETPMISAQRVRALGETRSVNGIPLIKEAIQQTSSSLVIIAGIESYQKIAQQSNEMVKKDFLKTATLLFGRNDPGISYSSAVAFQDTSIGSETKRIYLSALLAVYQKMRAAVDLEPMVELLNVFSELADSSALPAIEQGMREQDKVIRTAAEKAFLAVTGSEPTIQFDKQQRENRPFYTLQDFSLLKRYKGADIYTLKGKIKITFEKEAAPLTVLNFILLAQKKFYDGLSFHRVVSNFVIQGGDPLGNGSGGPKYAIRTEVHPKAKYKSGAVGMASAGKDTEGSQWFITHCPTPHLDFRYTVFGYTGDSKIVDQIQVGDTIQRVELF